MNVGQLIKQLEKFDPKLEIAILDGFNAGGEPRTINYTPTLRDPMEKGVLHSGGEYVVCRDTGKPVIGFDYSDIDSEPWMPIVVIGYGFY